MIKVIIETKSCVCFCAIKKEKKDQRMGVFSVFLLLSLMTTVLNAHDAPQFAGAVNITHSDHVWFVKLTLESMFGIAVSPR